MFDITFEDEVNRQWSSEYVFYTYDDAKQYLLDRGFVENNRLFERSSYNWSKGLKAYISPMKVYQP